MRVCGDLVWQANESKRVLAVTGSNKHWQQVGVDIVFLLYIRSLDWAVC